MNPIFGQSPHLADKNARKGLMLRPEIDPEVIQLRFVICEAEHASNDNEQQIFKVKFSNKSNSFPRTIFTTTKMEGKSYKKYPV
jgi:hypothetical protein